jgi:hypothetical protein
MTATRSYQENNTLALGPRSREGLCYSQATYVRSTSPNATQLQQKILSPDQHIGVWHGSHTLIGGWPRHIDPSNDKAPQTYPASGGILLSDLYPHGMELQCL